MSKTVLTCVLVLGFLGCASRRSAEREVGLTNLTIDRVTWADELIFPGAAGVPTLLCHVEEWEGPEALRRFTSQVDPSFDLVAAGHPVVEAHSGVGGFTDPEGDVRLAVIHLSSDLVPGVSYRLRPHNRKPPYRWTVAEAVEVIAPVPR